ncbi:MAG: hypothetical protein A2X53_18520 [Candidatus Rokubacteria bacterium GWA2_70_23]|nr:MAG: hypothetical protein A2X53_18520 [Candidatus Rokubacteria bacterium GWA2_70_23]
MAPEPPEILVIHPGALGDVLQAVPALRALGRLDGGSHVTLAAQPRLGRLLAGPAVVDEALSFDGLGLERLFADEAVPAVLAAQLGRAGRVVSWFGASDERYRERLRALVPSAVIAPPVPDNSFAGPVWQHLLATLAPWGVAASSCLSPLVLPEAWRALARHALAGLGAEPERPILAVHAGAGAVWKRWPAADLARVIERAVGAMRCQVLVHQGPADHEATTELHHALRERGAGRGALRLDEPDLPLLASVLQASTAFIGADSGVSHLAAAVGTASVILFPQATRERWAPWSPTALPLRAILPEGDVDRVAQALVARLDSSWGGV